MIKRDHDRCVPGSPQYVDENVVATAGHEVARGRTGRCLPSQQNPFHPMAHRLGHACSAGTDTVFESEAVESEGGYTEDLTQIVGRHPQAGQFEQTHQPCGSSLTDHFGQFDAGKRSDVAGKECLALLA